MSLNALSGSRKSLLGAITLSALFGFASLAPMSTTAAAAQTAASTQHAAQLNNFTSNDWNKGTWRASPGVSIPATAANKAAFKKDGKIRLGDGQIRTIKAIYFSGAHMSLMLDGAQLNANSVGHPKSVTALASAATPAPSQPAPAPTPGNNNGAHSSAINDYTNNDWIKGVWRKSAGFSLPTTAANRDVFKPGASVRLADGQVRTVTAIYISGNNMSVMLNGATIGANLGHPNKLFAATATTQPSTPTTPSTPAPAPAPTKPAPTPTPAPNPTPTPAPVADSGQTVTLNAFNGKDFTGGIYLTSPGFSVKDTPANQAAFHKGAKVRFADGQIRTVKVVYRSGGNMTVLVDGGAIDGKAVGYPRTISVSSTGFSQPRPGNGSPSQGGSTGGTPINLVGVNLAGAEFSAGNSASDSLPGRYLIHYIYPGEADFKRYADLGMKLVRLPFRWERIQPKLNTELNAAELGRLMTTLDHARKHNVQVILDMHNYYRYYGKLIASNDVPISTFADSWRRIAQKVANHPAVYGYGLMNEPHSTNGKWPEAALAASKAIREIDRTRWIYVAGDRWSSAYHWPSYNTRLVNDPWMRDPKNNLVYEAHLYLDHDFSGSYANRNAVYDPMTGVNRAKPFVEWLRKHGLRGFIGEHGAPDYSPSAIVATDNLLKYLGDNCIPSTYWAAGPWWGEYALSLDVKSGKPRPQLPMLRKHTGNTSCTSIGPF
ncbi:glycoside hydrolase family 5 protein [Pseudomonas saudiphocaensis]|uniref:Endoglucanase n=1 Tax=Pseudomonas saudiphocaensis TaxID=1499686 RepID=A0A078LSI9_9PSED|nr:glycoside hydrolase family 5 protein [Pseudomonas saudiphocaensis]CDZ94139.1 endoglucanase [Pseudomonas saudiphocaensis]